jgi:hypothetical protein
MTTYWLSVTRAQAATSLDTNVAVATSDPAADIALEWLSTNSPTRQDLVLACELFRVYIENGGLLGVDLPPN